MVDAMRRNNYFNGPQNDYWKWFLIYIGISFVISLIIPFPVSLIVYLLLFVVLNFIRTDITLRKSGMKDGVKGLYKSMSSGFSNGNIPGNIGYSPIKFMCMNCSKEHNERTCPRCGSTAVRPT
ncbi:MAG TPA: hypothetical protein VH415_03155 [Nitrososphaeraceae archaeon]